MRRLSRCRFANRTALQIGIISRQHFREHALDSISRVYINFRYESSPKHSCHFPAPQIDRFGAFSPALSFTSSRRHTKQFASSRSELVSFAGDFLWVIYSICSLSMLCELHNPMHMKITKLIDHLMRIVCSCAHTAYHTKIAPIYRQNQFHRASTFSLS